MKVFEDDEDNSDEEVYIIQERPKAAGPAPVKPENLAKRDLRTGSKLAFGSGASSATANYDDGVPFPVLLDGSKAPIQSTETYFKVINHQNQMKNVDFEDVLEDVPKTAKSQKSKKLGPPVEIVKKEPKPSQP